MAKITIKTADEFALKLSKLATDSDKIAKKAIYAAAEIVADQISANIKAIPEDKFRFLRNGDKYESITADEKSGLIECFGITNIRVDENSDWNAKCGFSEYLPNMKPTEKYPNGIPAAMLARSVESGSSVRRKHPFMRPAIAKTKEKAKAAMAKVIDEEIEKTMGGK